MSLTDTASVPLAETAAGVLDAVRETRAARDREDARLLALAVAWAVLHPAESVEELHEADPWLHADRPVVLAGEGTPRVGEFAIADFAGALRLPTESGRDLIADALELCHRLPRLWRRVQAGELPAWRARRIAHATMTLPVEGARFVDDRVAAFAHTVGPATVDRLVEEALVRFDPDTARERAEAAAENRHVTVRTDQVDSRGTVYLSGELDWPTPWTWTGRWTMGPAGSPRSARPAPTGRAGRPRWVTWPGSSPPWTPRSRRRAARPRGASPGRAARWCCTCTCPPPPSSQAETARTARGSSWRGWTTPAPS